MAACNNCGDEVEFRVIDGQTRQFTATVVGVARAIRHLDHRTRFPRPHLRVLSRAHAVERAGLRVGRKTVRFRTCRAAMAFFGPRRIDLSTRNFQLSIACIPGRPPRFRVDREPRVHRRRPASPPTLGGRSRIAFRSPWPRPPQSHRPPNRSDPAEGLSPLHPAADVLPN